MKRTTITLPDDLFEKLRFLAFSERKSLSEIVRDKLNIPCDKARVKPGDGFKALLELGSHIKKGQKYKFNRKKMYEEITEHKLSFGH